MRAALRRERIVELAASTGLASVEDLSREFGVTASTIRRDLARLTADGRLARTYGGAIAVPARETAPDERAQLAQVAKRAIGARAAAEVEDGETVLLDAGTTTAALAAALHRHRGLRVVTTGLTPLQALGDTHETVCLGGHLRAISQSFVGPLTEAALETLTFDRVFLGADGVNPERGICEATLDQTRLKELMWRRSRHTYVLADASKLGAEPFHAWLRMPEHWTLVTDAGAPAEMCQRFRDRGVTVVTAGPGTA
ncbi:DeoR/GlpR family DNA-binding transcription regulator [Desertihabitans aurantiacus]|uniref:DeoR/GlpR family DNA-binding transcription regulator n=1 Tax=Desertihabitans aurantiacus TaxID=2282477 RepID=UPI000DF75534|nr:DeoR/GlpR family DNA-binding transcription regulator [Desertihabitans aurantiacus]